MLLVDFELILMTTGYVILLLMLVCNAWNYVLGYQRMIELKVLYFFAMLQVLVRITSTIMLYFTVNPNWTIFLGFVATICTVGIGMPQALFFSDLYVSIKIVEANARQEFNKEGEFK